MNSPLRATLLYDGDCGFCTQSAKWLSDRGAPIASWQSIPDLAELGLTEADVTSAAYWFDESGAAHRGHLGIGAALIAADMPWPIAGRIILTPPFRWLAGPIYALIAKNRFRLPGSTDACRLPSEPSD